MKNVFILVTAMTFTITGCGNGNTAGTTGLTPSKSYLSAVLDCVNRSTGIIGNMIPAANAAATRIMEGGRIYVTDDETIFRTGTEETTFVEGGGYAYPMHDDWGGFVAEACDRAGGLRHIQPVPVNGTLNENDVVLAGTLDLNIDAQLEQLSGYKDDGALVIVFGSIQSPAAKIADYCIPNGLEPGTVTVMDIPGQGITGPVAGIANVINMWTFTAEYVAAVTRQGAMPTMWQSMFVPGAAARNEPLGEHLFHSNMRIMPIEPHDLGMQYLTALKTYLENIESNELTKFAAAGKLCAGTISGGGEVVASLIGHFMLSQQWMPEYRNIFTIRDNEYGSKHLEGILESNDVWLHIGYSYTPQRELDYADRIGVKTVCVFTPGPVELGEGAPVAPDMDKIDIYIDPYWKHGDAVVGIADYDTDIIPPSGVIMITCYWMLLGETLLHLESDG